MPEGVPARDDQGLDRSLWAATAVPAPDCPPLEVVGQADVVVVGGGFTGLSAALHLAERGVSVTLLEAREPGWGASGRNGGQVICGFKHDLDGLTDHVGADHAQRMVDFGDGTADFVFGLIDRHGIDCDAKRGGWLQGVHSGVALSAIEAKVSRLQGKGAPVSLLTGAEAEAATGTTAYKAALFDKRGGTVQPLSLARGLAQAALGVGAVIHGNSVVESISREGQRWKVRAASGAVVTADRVLLCTNGYSDLTGLADSVKRNVVPFYSYQIATTPLSENLLNSLPAHGLGVSETRRVLAYYRVDSYGRFILGARGALDGSLADASFDWAKARLAEMFPRLTDVPLEYSWNGRVAITPDHLPRLLEVAPGLHAALGWNGRGVAMTISMGPVLADWLCEGSGEDLPVPVTPPRPIPFHGLRRPASRALLAWNLYLDSRELAK